MATDERLDELRLHWQELQQQGRSISVAELCADCPELADALQRKIETVRYWETFLGAETEPEPPRSTPRTWGKFTVVRALGEGGQASTLLVLDPDLRRHVVLKLFHHASTPQQQEIVLREGQALARVRSPYVAQCYSAERQDGVPYLVVEYIPGQDLARYTRTHPLRPYQALELTRQLAHGVAAVHACGLLHRDLKPANVLMGEDCRPRLVDFGLAVPLASEELARVSGTLAYMAPEQARGEMERIDARTDLFGLGAILYALLTGRPPYRAESRSALLKAASEGIVEPPRRLNPHVPRAVNDLCMRCLARDPAQRYASATELSAAILRLQKRRWWPWLAAASVLIVLLGVVSLLGVKGWLPGDRPESSDNLMAALTPLAAKLDVRVWKKADTSKGLTLDAPGALPLRAGDYIRVEAESIRPAYLYVIYLDAQGEAAPLFPWQKYKWEDRPVEQKRTRVNVPEDSLKDGAPLETGPSGIEAVLLLAREEPLSVEEVGTIRRLFTKAPPGKFDPLLGAVWLGAEERFAEVRDRGRPNLDQSGTMLDPVERLRRLMSGQLKNLAGEVRGVCYPFDGK
jgi:serine/threonine-protein kinase